MDQEVEYKKPTLLNPFPDGVMPEIPGDNWFKRFITGRSPHLYFALAIVITLLTGLFLIQQGVSTSRAIDDYMFPTMAVRPADFRLEVLQLEEVTENPGTEQKE